MRFSLLSTWHLLGRLIPLAMLSICEATSTLDDFHDHMTHSSVGLRLHSEQYSKVLHQRLENEMAFLKQTIQSATSGLHAAVVPFRSQDLANGVTSNVPQHLDQLQQAFQSAIGGYDQKLRGNCLYFFAPPEEEVLAVDNSVAYALNMTGNKSNPEASKSSIRAASSVLLTVVAFVAGISLGSMTTTKF